MSGVLSFLSAGLVGGVVGGFLGGFSKFFWEHYLPGRLTWQRQQQLEVRQLVSHYRAPTVRATLGLESRIHVIRTKGKERYAYLRRTRQTTYYDDSTAFLIANFFGWTELLKRKTSHLDYSDLAIKLDAVTHAFSHGYPGFQIFRLEQQELGERMINSRYIDSENEPECLSYASFCDLLEQETAPRIFKRLRRTVHYLMTHVEEENERLANIQQTLVAFRKFLDPGERWARGLYDETPTESSDETG
jgi:hypothetical protein